MQYRAVKNRCAVNLRSLKIPVSEAEALEILQGKEFKVLEVNLITLARQCIKTSIYRRGAKSSEAPIVVDCSSFIKWLYGQRGIWLPRRSIQQKGLGVPVNVDEISAGDVIFVSGLMDYSSVASKTIVPQRALVSRQGSFFMPQPMYFISKKKSLSTLLCVPG